MSTPPVGPQFSVRRCSLGFALVAATRRGVCAIAFGDRPGPLSAACRRRFPGARPARSDPGFNRLAARVLSLVERPATRASVPLDLAGTPFQRDVWSALRRIRPGKTATYAGIARQIHRPGAVRAVAAACAANPVAVAVPCHRVVRSDGALSGYRWGVKRKRILLARETAARL